MSLRKSLYALIFWCLLASLLLIVVVFVICNGITSSYPSGGIELGADATVAILEQPTQAQQRLLVVLDYARFVSCVLFPVCGLGIAGILFYHWKLKEPINSLRNGAERIQNHDLNFLIRVSANDEMGQLCAAFETMRAQLLKTNQELWRQIEERKRLNAAFAHDLRNPITVLKGTVKLLRQGVQDEQTINRLESYTSRIEQYIEAMSSIQRLEQIPLQLKEVDVSELQKELKDTAKLFAPAKLLYCNVSCSRKIVLDHGLFLTVAENLIGNAARFTDSKIELWLTETDDTLTFSVIDDGPGYLQGLLQSGPKPFGKMDEAAEHFGMGLYSCQVLCSKCGGKLVLSNANSGGAIATALFQINKKP